MTAPLSPELERFVPFEIESGHFASREAVIKAALSTLRNGAGINNELGGRGFGFDGTSSRIRAGARIRSGDSDALGIQ